MGGICSNCGCAVRLRVLKEAPAGVSFEGGEEAFYDGFREGMKAALEHVERIGAELFVPEKEGELSTPQEVKDLLLRCMSKFADHALDHADGVLLQRRKR